MASSWLAKASNGVGDWLALPSSRTTYHAVPASEDTSRRPSTSLGSDTDIDVESADGLVTISEKPLIAPHASYSPRRIFSLLLALISRALRQLFTIRQLWVLLPAPIARRFGRGAADGSDAVPKPNAANTSYLNGLRGIASLVVAVQHNTGQYFHLIHYGWDEQAPENSRAIQLPLVRTVVNGSLAVTLFFVISGFALSYGPLKRCYAGRAEDAIASLPSSVFRRGFRLFLPVVPILFISKMMVHWELMYKVNSDELIPAPATLIDTLYSFRNDLAGTITSGGGLSDLPQVWTLAAEFRGSILVFLLCLALAHVKPLVRIGLVVVFLSWRWWLGHWEQSLFIFGMLLADLRHLRDSGMAPSPPAWLHRTMAVASWVVFCLGLWVGGFPIYGDGVKGWGFQWLGHKWLAPSPNWIPANRYWHSLAAMAMIASLENMPWMQRKLNARWVLYLGEISYGLYLVHWNVGINRLGKGTIISLRSSHSELVAWMIGSFLLVFPTMIWMGDVYWRLVDQRSVRFAKWLNDLCGV